MKRAMLTVAAMSAALALFAEDEAEATAEASCELGMVDGNLAHVLVARTNEAPVRAFTTLPLCRRIEGRASVRKPGGGWEPAVEGRFYPFGTFFRAEKDGKLVVAFGRIASATIENGDEFGTREQDLSVKSRTIIPVRGTIALKLPDNLPEGAFVIAAPGFTVRNPAGESVVIYGDRGDGDEAVIRCKTGLLALEGRHFRVPSMRAADEIRIRASHDNLFTSLYGVCGNYVVVLDQGMCSHEDIDDDGNRKTVVEPGFLDWHLSPRTKVVINRSVPAIGERMSVHTMTFDAAGVLQNERAFSEGRAEVNSGELVVKQAMSGEELARKAAEITETEAATDAEDDSDGSNEKTSDEDQL